jgi:hypothetical protein
MLGPGNSPDRRPSPAAIPETRHQFGRALERTEHHLRDAQGLRANLHTFADQFAADGSVVVRRKRKWSHTGGFEQSTCFHHAAEILERDVHRGLETHRHEESARCAGICAIRQALGLDVWAQVLRRLLSHIR